MELKEIRENIGAEIAALRQAITDREGQIVSLTEANQTARERIDQLRDAEAAIESALSKLNELGPLGSARSGRGPWSEDRPKIGSGVSTVEENKTRDAAKLPRGHIRQAIMRMLTNAGTSGMTIEEIADHYERQYDRQLNPASVRTLLYQAAHDGLTERRENGTWRLRSGDPQLEAAE